MPSPEQYKSLMPSKAHTQFFAHKSNQDDGEKISSFNQDDGEKISSLNFENA